MKPGPNQIVINDDKVYNNIQCHKYLNAEPKHFAYFKTRSTTDFVKLDTSDEMLYPFKYNDIFVLETNFGPGPLCILKGRNVIDADRVQMWFLVLGEAGISFWDEIQDPKQLESHPALKILPKSKIQIGEEIIEYMDEENLLHLKNLTSQISIKPLYDEVEIDNNSDPIQFLTQSHILDNILPHLASIDVWHLLQTCKYISKLISPKFNAKTRKIYMRVNLFGECLKNGYYHLAKQYLKNPNKETLFYFGPCYSDRDVVALESLSKEVILALMLSRGQAYLHEQIIVLFFNKWNVLTPKGVFAHIERAPSVNRNLVKLVVEHFIQVSNSELLLPFLDRLNCKIRSISSFSENIILLKLISIGLDLNSITQLCKVIENRLGQKILFDVTQDKKNKESTSFFQDNILVDFVFTLEISDNAFKIPQIANNYVAYEDVRPDLHRNFTIPFQKNIGALIELSKRPFTKEISGMKPILNESFICAYLDAYLPNEKHRLKLQFITFLGEFTWNSFNDLLGYISSVPFVLLETRSDVYYFLSIIANQKLDLFKKTALFEHLSYPFIDHTTGLLDIEKFIELLNTLMKMRIIKSWLCIHDFIRETTDDKRTLLEKPKNFDVFVEELKTRFPRPM